jgi:hypothetical protein
MVNGDSGFSHVSTSNFTCADVATLRQSYCFLVISPDDLKTVSDHIRTKAIHNCVTDNAVLSIFPGVAFGQYAAVRQKPFYAP